MLLGERINYLRVNRKWSLSELGTAAGGISKGHLSEIERGNMQPGIEVITKIANAFEMSPADLLGGASNDLTSEEQMLLDAYRAGDQLGAIRLIMNKLHVG
jgi:transcriptional regulator with XRE-family HTH domain